LEVQELLCDGLVCVLLGFLQRGRRTLQSRLCIHHQPTLDHPIVAQGKRLIAGVGIKGVPGVPRERWAQDRRDHLEGGGNPGDKAKLGTMNGVVCTIEFGIGDAIACSGCILAGTQQCLSPLLENLGV
jgi:hypothetical protein